MPDWTCRRLRQARRIHMRGVTENRRGQIQRAEATASQAHLLLEGDAHTHAWDMMAICLALGRVRCALSDYDGGAKVLEIALELSAVVDSPSTQVDALTLFGNVDRRRGRYAEAESLLRLAVRVAESTPLSGGYLPRARNALGILCKDTGRYGAARALYEQALDTATDTELTATILHNLAGLAHAEGDFTAAEGPARAAIDLRVTSCGTQHPDLAADLAVLGAVLYQQHRYVEAEMLFNKALTMFEKFVGPDHYEISVGLGDLAALYMDTGRLEEAEEYYLRAISIRTGALGAHHPETARLMNNLAVLYHQLHRPAQAAPLLEQAYAILSTTLGPDHPTTRACRKNGG